MFKVDTRGRESLGLMSWISQGNESPGLWKRLLIDSSCFMIMFMVQHPLCACVCIYDFLGFQLQSQSRVFKQLNLKESISLNSAGGLFPCPGLSSFYNRQPFSWRISRMPCVYHE